MTFLVLRIQAPPRSTRPDTLCPYTPLFRSRNHEMGNDVIDIKSVDEHLRAGAEFLLAAAGLRLLGHDVDVPAGEDRGEAHVLAAPADRQRKLVVRHHHLDAVGVRSEEHTSELQSLMRISYAVFCLKTKTQ